jgi:hypothetical protein
MLRFSQEDSTCVLWVLLCSMCVLPLGMGIRMDRHTCATISYGVAGKPLSPHLLADTGSEAVPVLETSRPAGALLQSFHAMPSAPLLGCQ